MRSILQPQSLGITVDVRLDHLHPAGGRRVRRRRLGPLSGLVEVGPSIAGEPDQRQDKGTIPQPPRCGRIVRRQSLGVEHARALKALCAGCQWNSLRTPSCAYPRARRPIALRTRRRPGSLREGRGWPSRSRRTRAVSAVPRPGSARECPRASDWASRSARSLSAPSETRSSTGPRPRPSASANSRSHRPSPPGPGSGALRLRGPRRGGRPRGSRRAAAGRPRQLQPPGDPSAPASHRRSPRRASPAQLVAGGDQDGLANQLACQEGLEPSPLFIDVRPLVGLASATTARSPSRFTVNRLRARSFSRLAGTVDSGLGVVKATGPVLAFDSPWYGNDASATPNVPSLSRYRKAAGKSFLTAGTTLPSPKANDGRQNQDAGSASHGLTPQQESIRDLDCIFRPGRRPSRQRDEPHARPCDRESPAESGTSETRRIVGSR